MGAKSFNMMHTANTKKEGTSPSVDIIIVNYGKGWLHRCLKSVLHTQYPLSKLEIIVVDNASNDKDLQLIESTFSGVRLLRLEKNVGYPMAVNIGAERSEGEYIAVLNNDVIVPPGWLAELICVLERDGTVGAICPRKESLYMKQTLDGCGGAFNILGQGWDRGQYEADIGQYSSLDEVVNPSGAVFVTRRRLMNEFGFLLNPDFFMVLDDLDFGLRCWKAGYRVLYSPTCVVYHARGPSLGGLSEHKNLYFYSRNLLASTFEVFDLSFFIRLFPILIATQLTQALYLLFFHRKSHAVPSVFRAVVDFLSNLRVYAKRRATMRMAFKKGDKTLVARFTPTLAVFEESKNHTSLILAFLSAINFYVRLFLRVQPIRDIIYIRKTPK